MRTIKQAAGIALALAMAVAPALAGTRHHVSRSRATHKIHARQGGRRGAWRQHGQQAIQPQRVREIQEALIRGRYMEGAADGIWDDRTREALVRLQSEQGWQTKIVPDSRALIKLGLGPSHVPSDSVVASRSSSLGSAPVAGAGVSQ